MAFVKYANATVVHPDVGKTDWGKIRTASRANIAKQDIHENLVTRAASLFGKPFKPNDYLMTHATIVASVDTMESGLPTGSFLMDGFRGNRKYSDFRVKPECDKFLNNNLDGWARGVLQKAYPTFIGGHNFCFVPGTKVLMSNGVYKAIETVIVGDAVVSHQGQVRKVVKIFERDYAGDIQALFLDQLTDPILATPNHPFFGFLSVDLQDWIPASDLKEKSLVLGPKNKKDAREIFHVRSNDVQKYTGKVYNFEVETDNSYVVFPGVAVHNCEHVQIEELSKGRIIDAVARDIGESLYVDILIATERKHKDLVKAIENHKMSTLSMGCFLPGTQVTMADGRRVSIEDVQPGDMVFTHKGRAREVLDKQLRSGSWKVKKIQAEGIQNTIVATDNHPFYVNGVWVRADDLKVGDLLCAPDSKTFAITSIVSDTYVGWIHNMEVEEDNSYVVEGVSVHNCTTDFTLCTKCGHLAVDESELCGHIKYEKGNTFYDEQGRHHRVAEICGSKEIDPHAGVNFIEASWVGMPAFTGAVLRNILVPGADLAKKAQEVLASPPPQWASDSRILSASSGTLTIPRFMPPQPGVRVGNLGDPRLFMADDDVFLAGWADEEPKEDADAAPSDDAEAPATDDGAEAPAADAPKAPPPKEPDDPFKGLEDEMVKTVKDRVQKRLKNELNPTNPGPSPEQSSMKPNSNVVKEAKVKYLAGLDALVRTASSEVDLINAVASYNEYNKIKIPVPLYRAALKVGSSVQYASVEAFLDACRVALKREPTVLEARTLLRLGKLIARGHGVLRGNSDSRQGGPT